MTSLSFIPTNLGVNWERKQEGMVIHRENCVFFLFFFCSHVCLSLQSVDRFGQVCHIVALGAWVCGEVPAQCLCVEGSLLFTKE